MHIDRQVVVDQARSEHRGWIQTDLESLQRSFIIYCPVVGSYFGDLGGVVSNAIDGETPIGSTSGVTFRKMFALGLVCKIGL
jgi:hypothetical protein